MPIELIVVIDALLDCALLAGFVWFMRRRPSRPGPGPTRRGRRVAIAYVPPTPHEPAARARL
jgi:hypothetical protein